MKDLVNMPLGELIALAHQIRDKYIGNKLDLCTIINAKSGLCSEDCKFCAQSAKHRTGVPVYPLKNKAQLVNAALKAKQAGAGRFGIVTSGNCLSNKDLSIIIAAITEIKNKIGIEVCASLGALGAAELKQLKSAGLSRYHHNIETSPEFYTRIVTTHSFAQRVATIKAAKQVGLSVCSGGIIGMGESWQDRISMAKILKQLNVDAVPLNILVAIKGTALEGISPISCGEVIRTIAIFRILLKNKTIKIAAGRETVLNDFQGLGFMAGANGMLIGGYLTIKGRSLDADYRLINEIKKLWAI